MSIRFSRNATPCVDAVKASMSRDIITVGVGISDMEYDEPDSINQSVAREYNSPTCSSGYSVPWRMCNAIQAFEARRADS